MKEVILEKYFNTGDNYYEPKILIQILEDILDKNISDIQNYIVNAKIVVTTEQIKEYLDKKFEEENLEVKIRLKNTKHVSQDINKQNDSKQFFMDQMVAASYYFEPYTLEYFDKYTTIVRSKAILLLSIILKIVNKESFKIQDLMTEIDIQVNEKGNIKREDIIRLIIPAIYNINALEEKITQANDLETYLTYKKSLGSLYRDDVSEDELYPTEAIQVKNLCYAELDGNVPLSENQKNELHEKESKIMKKIFEVF